MISARNRARVRSRSVRLMWPQQGSYVRHVYAWPYKHESCCPPHSKCPWLINSVVPVSVRMCRNRTRGCRYIFRVRIHDCNSKPHHCRYTRAILCICAHDLATSQRLAVLSCVPIVAAIIEAMRRARINMGIALSRVCALSIAPRTIACVL